MNHSIAYIVDHASDIDEEILKNIKYIPCPLPLIFQMENT